MDTSWIDLRNDDPAFFEGCKNFIELAKETSIEGKTLCPCNKCKVSKWFPLQEVRGHILFNGFLKSYRKWIFHMKETGRGNKQVHVKGQDKDEEEDLDDMGVLLREAIGVHILDSTLESEDYLSEQNNEEGQFDDTEKELFEENDEFDEFPSFENSDEEAKYNKLVEASSRSLYEGCNSFSKLSFLLHMFHLKCMYHWSAQSFNKLLELLLDAFPHIKEFPSSYYEGKKIINDLGMGYEKIDACPNDCMLYYGEMAGNEECHICHTSRWKATKGNHGSSSDKGKAISKKGEPAKVLRYFPLIPRLKRLYMSSKTAKDMRWHKEGEDRPNHDDDEVKDVILCHPADGKAWKEFDKRYGEFAGDSRSVRLGLATDGFNPYRLMSTTHSTWPVVLIPYNLPPWLCMKPSSFILSMIIPGKSGPGNKIDVYLRPLLNELKMLWEGVTAFDSHSGKNFKLRAALHSTINDFPAYAMLSGWSTKGYKACPSCTNSTHSYRFGGKICYPCSRKWLPLNHPYRSQAHLFDGTSEFGDAPIRASGSEVLRQQEDVALGCGKSKKSSRKRGRRQVRTSNDDVDDAPGEGDYDVDDDDDVTWTKKSALFELEYWEHNVLRHNLDVMHIEKNVCDNILGTLLGTEKSRDDIAARKALEQMNIKSHLWLQPDESHIPPASYTMSTTEKDRFLRVLQKLRVPDGYGSNLQRCVNLKQRKLMNMKTHDNHVIMQDILPVALRASNATKVIDLLEDLSTFFKKLCSPTIRMSELDDIQSKVVLVLCNMEKEFLPTFFTIMVHLLIHLVEEVKLGGPVHYRWMYPIERYLAFLKSHVTNKAQPEGSIAEGYLLWETITFCSRYLEGVETIFNRPRRNDDGVPNMDAYLFNSGCRVVGMKQNIRLDDKSLRQAHRYILLHADELLKPAFDEFIRQKRQENRSEESRVFVNIENEWIVNEYAEWLRNQAYNIDDNTAKGKLSKALASGPSGRTISMKSVFINGYKFDIVDRERYRKTQNSGIMVQADNQEFYGKLKAIYELYYYGSFKVVLFRCDWVDINKGIQICGNGGVRVNFSKLMHTGRNLHDDPFILSSQATQVFYVADEIQKGWLHVIKTKPRDLFDTGNDLS